MTLAQLLRNLTSPGRFPLRRAVRVRRGSPQCLVERLEQRVNPASLTVTWNVAAAHLTIADTSGVRNDLEVDVVGSNLVITDNLDSFHTSPAIGTLSNSNRTLTVSKSVIGSLTIDAGGGSEDDITHSGSLSGLSGSLSYLAESIVIGSGASIDITGDISLTGTGTSTTGGGVYLERSSSAVETLIRVSGSNSTITISGTGGSTSSASNPGVFIGNRSTTDDGTIRIEAVNGDIEITGTGGVWNAPSTSASSNLPGLFMSATTVRTTGNGDIRLTGIGPTSSSSEYGDRDGMTIQNNSTIRTGSGGGISITGYGYGTGEAVDISGDSTTQILAGAGGITITGRNDEPVGRGGASVELAGTITSSGGSIEITGTGGISGSPGVIVMPDSTGDPNVLLGNAQTTFISITGTVAGGSSDGVQIDRVTARSVGVISVTGTGRSSGRGLAVLNSTLTTTTGSISLSGTSTGSGEGFWLDGSNLDSGSAAISLTGQSGTSGGDGLDISDSVIGTASTSSVAITGTARGGSGDNDGMTIAATAIAAAGSVVLTGTAKTSGEGVDFNSGSSISGATVDLFGLAQASVAVEVDGSTITATSGGVLIDGDSTGTTSGSTGVIIASAVISATSGDITIDGTAASAAVDSSAVQVASATLQTTSGNILLSGTGTIDAAVAISASTLDPGTGLIRIDATAGLSGTTGGDALDITGSTIGTTSTASIELTATAGAGTGDSDGIYISGSLFRTAGTVTVTGTASGTGEAMEMASSSEMTAVGDISITLEGVSGTAVFEYDNSMIRSSSGSLLITAESTGSAPAIMLGGESTTTQQDTLHGATGVTLRGNLLNLHQSTGTAGITGGGDLVIESIGSAFTSEVSTAFVNFGSSFSNIRIGKSTNTSSITVGALGISAGTDVTITGGTVTVSGDISADALNITAATLNSTVGTAVTSSTAFTAVVSTGGTLAGVISGAGSFTRSGSGTLVLSGSNTYSGITTVSGGTLQADSASALGTTAGSTTVASGAALDVRANIGTESLQVAGSGISGSGVLITGSGAGTVGGTVSMAANSSMGGDGNLTISGAISGSWALAKVGSGTLTLAGANSYSGDTTISAGTLLVNGSTQINSNLTVSSGSTLGGNLTVNGAVSVSSGGTVAPGTSPGMLNTGSITFTSGSVFAVEVGGTTVGTQYDQLNVTGSVNLGNATLNLSQLAGFLVSSASLQTYVIINNDGTDDVTGTFNGLPEGSPVSYASGTLYISYAGSADGSAGNDVVLNSRPIVNGTSIANTITFRRSTAASRNEYSIDGATFIQVPDSLPVRFNGAAGSDTLTVDYINGDPAVAVEYFAGGNSGDMVFVEDLVSSNRTGVFSINAAAPSSAGSLRIGSNTLGFSGVVQAEVDGIATVSLDSTAFPAANNSISISGSTNHLSESSVLISGVTGGSVFVSLHLRNSSLLALDSSSPSGNDSVTISNITSAQTGLAALSVATGAGSDSITVQGATSGVDLTGAVSLSSGGSITVNQLGLRSGGTVILDASGDILIEASGIEAAGAVTLTADGAIATSSALPDITAPALSASAGTSIELDTVITTLTLAAVSGTGDIDISDGSGGLMVTSATTADGNITLNASGGHLTLTSVAAGGSGADVSLTTMNSGDILVSAVTATGNVTISAAAGGSIQEAGSDGGSDITAATASLTGPAGIGSAGAIEINLTTLTLAITTLPNASISLVDTAGGLAVTSASTVDGAITLGANNGYLSLTSISANGSGRNIELSTTVAGNILVGDVSASGDTIAITAAGAIEELGNDSGADLSAISVSLTASAGIGHSGVIEASVETAAAVNLTSGNIQLSNDSGTALSIGTVGVLGGLVNNGGDISLATFGPLSIIEDVTAAGDILLVANDTSTMADHLFIFGTVLVGSTTGSILLAADDDLIIPIDAEIEAGQDALITLMVDDGDADSPDVGSTAIVLGRLSFSGTGNGEVELYGGDDADTLIFWDGTDGATINCGTGTLTVYAGDGNDSVVTGNADGLAAIAADTGAPGVVLYGEEGVDFFSVQAMPAAAVHVDGGSPDQIILPGYIGDTLLMYLGSAEDVVFTLTGLTSGFGVSSTTGDVTLESVEIGVVVPGAGGAFDLVVDMNSSEELESNRLKNANGDDPDTVVVLNLPYDSSGTPFLTVAYQGSPGDFDVLFAQPAGSINSVTILGSEDDDTLVISEDAVLGLPTLTAAEHARGGYINPTLTARAGITKSAVHFEGGGGSDVLAASLVTSRDLVFAPDMTAGEARPSGNLAIDQLGVSFEGVETQFLTGTGGTLTIDATEMASSADLGMLVFDDFGGPTDGLNLVAGAPAGNFAATIFSGFGVMNLTAGAGGNQVVLVGSDQSMPVGAVGVEALAELTIQGGAADDLILFQPGFSSWTGGLEAVGGGGLDGILSAADLVLAPGKDLSFDAEFIQVNAGLSVTGSGSMTLNGTGTGSVPLHWIDVQAALMAEAGGISITGNNLVLSNSIFTSSSGVVSIQISGITDIASAGDIFADGVVSVNSAGGIASSGDIRTTADTIDIHSVLTLTGNVRLDTGAGGDVTLHAAVTSGVDNLHELVLDAGATGQISVLSTIGGSDLNDSRLATVRLIDSFGAVFSDVVRTGTSIVVGASRRDRDIRFVEAIISPLLNAPEDPRRTDGIDDPPGFEFDDEYNLLLYGDGTHITVGSLFNTGKLYFGDDETDSLIFENGISATGQSEIYLKGIPVTYGSPVILGDVGTDVYVNDGTSIIDTTYGSGASGPESGINPDGADITIGGDIVGVSGLGGENLTFIAGLLGDVTIVGGVGVAAPIDTLLIQSASDVRLNTVFARLLSQTAGTGTTYLNGPVTTTAGEATDVGEIESVTPDPSLTLPLAPRLVNLGVDILNVNVVLNALITTDDGGVRLRATAGSSGVVTLNNEGTIHSDLDVILEGNALAGPAIVVNAPGTWRLGMPGEDVVVGTRRRFLTVSDADVEFRGDVSFVATPSRSADIFFIDTGSGPGNITFTHGVDVNLSDLDVRSGLGSINFRGDVTEVHRLFVQDNGDGILTGSTPTTVTFVGSLNTERLLTAAGNYHVDLLGAVSVLGVNVIQYYLPNDTVFLNSGRVTLGDETSDRVSVLYGLSTTAAAVTHMAGIVEAMMAINLSPIVLSPAGTAAELRNTSVQPITVAEDASGRSVSQSGDNTLILGTATSRSPYLFSGDLSVGTLITNPSDAPWDLAVLGSLEITATSGTLLNNRGVLQIGSSSSNTHRLSGSLTVNTNSTMSLSGRLRAEGDVVIGVPLSIAGVGAASIEAAPGSLTLADVTLGDGVDLVLGSAMTTSITVAGIDGTVSGLSSTIGFNTTGQMTVTGTIRGDISALTVVNSAGADFQRDVGPLGGGAIGSVVLQASSGQVIVRGRLGASTLTATSSIGDILLPGGSAISGAVSLSNSGRLVLGDGIRPLNGIDEFRFSSGMTRSGGPTSLFGLLRTISGPLTINGVVSVSGPSRILHGSSTVTLGDLVLESDASLQIGVGAGDSGPVNLSTVGASVGAVNTMLRIGTLGQTTVAGAITGLTAIEIGSGVSLFSGSVGTSTTPIGRITRRRSVGTTTFVDDLFATTFAEEGGRGHLNLHGSTTRISTASVLNTSGSVNLGNGGDSVNFAGGLTHTAGPTVLNGTITTTNTSVVLGAIIVTGLSRLTTGLGGGNIDLNTVSNSGVASLTLVSGTGNILVRGAVTGLMDLTLENAANVDFRGGVSIVGDLVQFPGGTGTTTLRGGSIGGEVSVQAITVSLASGTLTTTDSATLSGTGSVSMGAGATLDSQSGVVRISTGSGGFSQASTALITSSSTDGVAAIQVLVSGGNATLGALTATSAGGRIRVVISGAGSILDGNDSSGSSQINLTAPSIALAAPSRTIGTAANPIEYSSASVPVTTGNSAGTVFLRNATPNASNVIARYDFGRTSIVQDRFVGVSATSTFSTTAAFGSNGSYGFVSRPTEVLRAGTVSGKQSVSLYRDSVMSKNTVTFRMRLPSNSSGPYLLRAYFGDGNTATSTVVTGFSGTTMTGTLASGTIGAAAFTTGEASVTDDGDGILQLQFSRPTGYTGQWSMVGLDIATGSLPDAAPQLLSGLEFEPGGELSEESRKKLAAVEQRGVSLSEPLLLEVREQVLDAWAAVGLAPEALDRLRSATIEISDLNQRGMLGIAGFDTIRLDDDALGYGWSFRTNAGGLQSGAANAAVPSGTIDLATVMAHEFGHLLGWRDLDPERNPGHLMSAELSVGESRSVETVLRQPVITMMSSSSGNTTLASDAVQSNRWSVLERSDAPENSSALVIVGRIDSEENFEAVGLQSPASTRKTRSATSLNSAAPAAPISEADDLQLLDDVFASAVELLG
jgi:autotransporter-associated beta strand protein